MGGKRTASAWAVLLATLLLTALTARLGWWQLERAAQKQSLEQLRRARQQQPVLALADLDPAPAAVDALWQRTARLQGVWLAEETVYLDNRPMRGRAGFYVLTPLLLEDGRLLLVQRGWLPRDGRDRTRIAPYRTERGPVRVQGYIAPQPARTYELGRAASAAIRQNLDLADWVQQTRRRLLPFVLVQTQVAEEAAGKRWVQPGQGAGADPAPTAATASDTGKGTGTGAGTGTASGGTPRAASAPRSTPARPQEPADGLWRDWPAAAVDVHKNYGYALQWFGLSALVMGLYVWFQIIQPRRRTRH